MDCITEIRYYHFMAGVLIQQQEDTCCCRCKAFTNSVRATGQGIAELEIRRAQEISTLPEEHSLLLVAAKKTLSGLHCDPDAVGQKKAGNCRLPEGICFVKSSKALRNCMV
ncbi:MAG TPA: hypothetical protein VEP69_00410 [Thermodesulfovibrionales bacterium]|nr:hypothetical protein [Thermodesulfovibrionales bacterium]